MSAVDLEQGGGSQSRRLSFSRSDVSGDGSVCFSDADDGSYDEYNFAAVVSDPAAEVGVAGVSTTSESRRDSSVSECSVHVVEIEVGAPEIKVHLDRVERDCRICHLGLESNSHESGAPIELGCSCKHDLGSAHRNCADAWFKIKGNKICEICHSIARNIVGPNDIEMIEQLNNEATSECLSYGCSFSTRAFNRDSKLLARSSLPQFPSCLYGICFCHIMALSLQRSFVRSQQRSSSEKMWQEPSKELQQKLQKLL